MPSSFSEDPFKKIKSGSSQTSLQPVLHSKLLWTKLIFFFFASGMSYSFRCTLIPASFIDLKACSIPFPSSLSSDYAYAPSGPSQTEKTKALSIANSFSRVSFQINKASDYVSSEHTALKDIMNVLFDQSLEVSEAIGEWIVNGEELLREGSRWLDHEVEMEALVKREVEKERKLQESSWRGVLKWISISNSNNAKDTPSEKLRSTYSARRGNQVRFFIAKSNEHEERRISLASQFATLKPKIKVFKKEIENLSTHLNSKSQIQRSHYWWQKDLRQIAELLVEAHNMKRLLDFASSTGDLFQKDVILGSQGFVEQWKGTLLELAKKEDEIERGNMEEEWESDLKEQVTILKELRGKLLKHLEVVEKEVQQTEKPIETVFDIYRDSDEQKSAKIDNLTRKLEKESTNAIINVLSTTMPVLEKMQFIQSCILLWRDYSTFSVASGSDTAPDSASGSDHSHGRGQGTYSYSDSTHEETNNQGTRGERQKGFGGHLWKLRQVFLTAWRAYQWWNS